MCSLEGGVEKHGCAPGNEQIDKTINTQTSMNSNMPLSDTQILIASVAAIAVGQRYQTVEDFKGMDLIPLMPNLKTFEAKQNRVKIDGCFVAETEQEVILSFRAAALPTNGILKMLKDWENNLERHLIPASDIVGRVHQGFLESVQNLEQKGLIHEIQTRIKSGKRLLVTGYSKGGALAPLAATRLVKQLKLDPSQVKVQFFASPKCGDREFIQAFNQMFPETIRYESPSDIITLYPFDEEFMARVIPALPTRVQHLFTKRNQPSTPEFIPGSSDYAHVGRLHPLTHNPSSLKLPQNDSPSERYTQLIAQLKSVSDIGEFLHFLVKHHSPTIFCQDFGLEHCPWEKPS